MAMHHCQQTCAAIAIAALVSTATTGIAAAQAPAGALTPVEVRGGTASFDVGTNVPALNVHGKSTSLEARGTIRPGANGPQLEQIEATVPVKTLGTGMGLRDEHMRKYVFTTADGQTPDVKFSARQAACSKTGASQSTCDVTGDLSIRGTARPFSISLKVTEDRDSYRASGDGIVKLSAYGIPQPSQLGVHTDDEIKLRLEFTARPAPVATTGVKSAARLGEKR
ncbi:MAG TPA: YceI family protein [Gemmatimonadales bacterium]|nr:YceI family protein [Gemmatimonadales bacterium]